MHTLLNDTSTDATTFIPVSGVWQRGGAGLLFSSETCHESRPAGGH